MHEGGERSPWYRYDNNQSTHCSQSKSMLAFQKGRFGINESNNLTKPTSIPPSNHKYYPMLSTRHPPPAARHHTQTYPSY